MKIVFEKEWWLRSFNRPREERHPIMHWAHLIQEQHSAIPIEPNKISSIPATGAMSAYLSLSYDLYSIAHNVEMQSKLVERLKNTEQFWGARYEVFTAATLIRAGFDVEFENEDDRTTTHCEFTATNRKSGRKFSVECKHRASTRSRIGRQLNKALQKQAKHERLIFIDVNESDISEHSDTKPMLLLKALNALRLFENKPIAGNYLPNSYIVISNTPHHHHLNSTNFRVGVLLEGFQIPDFKHDAMFQSLRDAIESKERHIELHDLALSIQDHSQIPSTFDGDIPEFAFGEAVQRLFVGKLYRISHNGKDQVGRLTSATVNEHEKKSYCAFHFEASDEAAIFTASMSDTELIAWRKHPDTFFGVPDQRQRQVRDPLELYEFFLSSFGKTDKSRLLELMADAPDIQKLSQLDQFKLAKEYCIRMASNVPPGNG